MLPVSQLNLSGLRIIDGAMATELEHLGCDLSHPLWSARVLEESPSIIEAVHCSYLQAGADCILTASYQVSAEGFAEQGLSAQSAGDALLRLVSLAESAREWYRSISGRPVWIGASLGPFGAMLHNGAEYHGNYRASFEEVVQFHSKRISVLASTNADFLAFETIPSLDEAGAIVIALEEHPDLAGWISFTCQDESHVAHGERLRDCGRLLNEHRQIIAIGINCTAPALISPLLRELSPATAKPIVVYPNSGEIWDADSRSWRGEVDPRELANRSAEWLAAGAHAIGGCCRTTPRHIQELRNVFDNNGV
jgi:homocysteine S-methyltransferase